MKRVATEVAKISTEIFAHLDDKGRGQALREGIYITIIGPPNAGKSALLNRLSRRDVAIVSKKAGTTRDVIEVSLELGGYPVILADTAGLRSGVDEIEEEGVRRAEERANQADLKLVVFDGQFWPKKDARTMELIDDNTVVVINKSDLLKKTKTEHLKISANNGTGIDTLLETLEREVASRCYLSASPALTRTRHRQALEACYGHLLRFSRALETELKAEDLRQAARALRPYYGPG